MSTATHRLHRTRRRALRRYRGGRLGQRLAAIKESRALNEPVGGVLAVSGDGGRPMTTSPQREYTEDEIQGRC